MSDELEKPDDWHVLRISVRGMAYYICDIFQVVATVRELEGTLTDSISDSQSKDLHELVDVAVKSFFELRQTLAPFTDIVDDKADILASVNESMPELLGEHSRSTSKAIAAAASMVDHAVVLECAKIKKDFCGSDELVDECAKDGSIWPAIQTAVEGFDSVLKYSTIHETIEAEFDAVYDAMDLVDEGMAAGTETDKQNEAELLIQVDLDRSTLTFKGEVFSTINYDTLRLFEALISKHPMRVAVSREFPDDGMRPKRIIDQLARDSATKPLAKLLDSQKGKGVALVLPQ